MLSQSVCKYVAANVQPHERFPDALLSLSVPEFGTFQECRVLQASVDSGESTIDASWRNNHNLVFAELVTWFDRRKHEAEEVEQYLLQPFGWSQIPWIPGVSDLVTFTFQYKLNV